MRDTPQSAIRSSVTQSVTQCILTLEREER
ncbi:hypothetical protein SAMN05444507_11080 [Pseudomonas syringae]|nr:hypothetical protein SAMN05444507_11080 [Pseudomonas syringae]